jgi:L-asparagine oxygenase
MLTPWALAASQAESQRMISAARLCAAMNAAADPEAFTAAADLSRDCLPRRLINALRSLRRHGHPDGGLLVRGLPVGEVPPTPADPAEGSGSGLPPAGLLGIIAACLGDQYGFAQQLGGRIIQDIVPVRGREDTQESVSSTAPLYTHVELAFADDDCRPDWIALLCLRGDPNAATTLSPVEAMLPLLPPGAAEVLAEPRFATTVDSAFLRGAARDAPLWIGPIRVLSTGPGRPRIRADFAETAGLDPAACDALAALRRAADTVAEEVRLQAGDVLVTENRHATHGRTAFLPLYGARARWLLRCSIARDLDRSAAQRPGNGRVVDTNYAALTLTAPRLQEAIG